MWLANQWATSSSRDVDGLRLMRYIILAPGVAWGGREGVDVLVRSAMGSSKHSLHYNVNAAGEAGRILKHYPLSLSLSIPLCSVCAASGHHLIVQSPSFI